MLSFGVGLSGVDRAVMGQSRAARREGLPIEYVVVGPDGEGVVDGVRRLRFRAPRGLGLRGAVYLKARMLASARELDEYDVLFLRYPTAVDLDPTALARARRGA